MLDKLCHGVTVSKHTVIQTYWQAVKHVSVCVLTTVRCCRSQSRL